MSMTTRRRDPFRTISARHHEDIASLVHGLIAFDQASSIKLAPVVAAAVLAFGFVYARIQGRIRKLRVDCFHASNGPYSTGQRQGPE